MRLALTPRVALVLLILVWLVAGGLYLASLKSSPDAAKLDHVRQCATEETFSHATCLATLPGTVTKLTYSKVDLDIQGRAISMPVTLHGDISGYEGAPVEVTLYRGEPVRVAGTQLHIDSDNSATTDAYNLLHASIGTAVVGTLVIVGNLIIGLARRPRQKPTANSAP
jgi:hypothetical protein